MFEIRNFGNNVKCDDANSVLSALSEKYAGKSVSVAFGSKVSGIKKILFVDVSNDGLVTHSYGDKAELNVESLN